MTRLARNHSEEVYRSSPSANPAELLLQHGSSSREDTSPLTAHTHDHTLAMPWLFCRQKSLQEFALSAPRHELIV
ncbi:uncharacterized protein LAESUDRAFT_721255 [Laetiporus sulphureus 93-53]|uniref:Uncharacterized protein n=1 Tax=Laetiporus sulphureus 93-53 TaxID=1314785 RepID=A0A165GVA4_9APHY|nr:uncharacterized protein LAESUDRAFT_721255 [Laetiporus sulphureus 93-53]KZT10866.1 hypothetical protein LAESUDRAFT_721255 [Laetiporus sulphureus 93-53]